MNEVSEVREVSEVKKVEMYSTAYDLLKSLFWHMTNKYECKGSKVVDDGNKHEVAWKCTNCNQSWRISVRKLRNTIRDSRLKEFGGFTYMNTFADLRKVIGR